MKRVRITPVRTAPNPTPGLSWFPCHKHLADGFQVLGPGIFDVYATPEKAAAAARRALDQQARRLH